MNSGLNRCLEALRVLSRSSEPEPARLITAELRIDEFLKLGKSGPAAQRALLEALENEADREASSGPQGAASFWRRIRNFIDWRLATLGDD
jgi:hypothetical protein